MVCILKPRIKHMLLYTRPLKYCVPFPDHLEKKTPSEPPHTIRKIANKVFCIKGFCILHNAKQQIKNWYIILMKVFDQTNTRLEAKEQRSSRPISGDHVLKSIVKAS